MTETCETYTIEAPSIPAVETDLGLVALDLIVKWAEIDGMKGDANGLDELLNAYNQLHTVETSMRGLANQAEAQRLAATMERDQALPFERPRNRHSLFKTE